MAGNANDLGECIKSYEQGEGAFQPHPLDQAIIQVEPALFFQTRSLREEVRGRRRSPNLPRNHQEVMSRSILCVISYDNMIIIMIVCKRGDNNN